MSRGFTIKSFVLSDSHDAIFGGGEYDSPGGFCRIPVDGFAIIAAGSLVARDVLDDDEIQPFEFGECGFQLVSSINNYLGVVKRGEDIPEWMFAWINKPYRSGLVEQGGPTHGQ
jgi:hypothetical protein